MCFKFRRETSGKEVIQMKNNAQLYLVLLVSLASLALTGCQEGTVSADKSAAEQETAPESLLSKVTAPFVERKFDIPAGTPIQIRLDQGVSSEKNTSGQRFEAHLNRPIIEQGKLLAPRGSKVVGELVDVKDAGKIRGRAEITLTLRKLEIGGQEYTLHTHPMVIRARGTKKRDAGVIAGTSALGAIIGAVAGGGKGAAIGAGAGAGAGTGIVLMTEGKEVEFPPETRFRFSLADPLELPVYSS
jgi:outer membrane lipoprotein SlyB